MSSSEFEVIHEITSATENLSLWCQSNCMKANTDKLHLLISERKIHQVNICNGKLPENLMITLLSKNTKRIVQTASEKLNPQAIDVL